jgi:hypothetical protein
MIKFLKKRRFNVRIALIHVHMHRVDFRGGGILKFQGAQESNSIFIAFFG